jgi:hypothetical protein
MMHGRHRFGSIVLGWFVAYAASTCPGVFAAQPAAGDGGTSNDPEITTQAIGSTVLRIVYKPSSLRLNTGVVEKKDVTTVSFRDAIHESPIDAAGLPDVPYRQIGIAFPNRAVSSVRIIASDYEDVRGVTVRPLPTLKDRDGFLETVGYIERPGAAQGLAPEIPVRLEQPVRVRSALIGGVRIWPACYDASAHTIRKYSRIVFEVTFGAGQVESVQPSDVKLLAQTIVNPEMFANWQAPTAPARKAAAASSVLATGDWYRLTVSEEGMYKIDASYLSTAGINTGSIDPRTIKIYGNGGRELPEDVSAARPSDLTQLAIYVAGESDGQLNTGDYILFYGRGARGLTYDSLSGSMQHVINHYSEANYYWLTFGGAAGKRMATQPSLEESPDRVVEQFEDAVYLEDEKVNLLSSGKDWLGQSLSGPSSSFTSVNALPGLVTGSTIKYRYSLVAHDETSPRFTVKDGGVTLGTYYLGRADDYLYATGGVWEAAGPSSLTNATSQLNITFTSSTSASEGWIDWFELRFPRMLWGVNNTLRFRSPDGTGVAEFRLQQFTVMPTVYNVTDHANVRVVSGLTGSYAFRDSLYRGTVSEYFASVSATWKTPSAIARMENQNLHGATDGARFIIVTSSEFLAPANRLAEYRRSATGGSFSVAVVNVSAIYNEFSGGVPDITAIRDYLKYAYENWTTRPEFVLFLGGASYDYKGILGFKSSYVPTWQSGESRHDVNSYATDDYFTSFYGSMIPSLISGRISSRSVAEANAVVEKIIRYENESARDSWKARMLYIGDDAWTPEYGETGDYTTHSDDAELLSSSSYTPDEIEKKKIYIAEYPTVYTAQGRRKPGAASDIIDDINKGVLVVNYAGHGNPKVWAHERIFEVTTSIPQFTNANRLALFFLATCNFSQFDDAQNYTGSELLMNKTDGGSSAVISASRKVYAQGNGQLHRGTFRRLFSRDAFGRVVMERPATALFLYKAAGNNLMNDQKFFFMGDPTMRLVYPSGFASIDSINGQPVDSVGGVARTSPIPLRALSKVTLIGTVRDAANRPDTSFNGTLTLGVNDVSRERTIVNFYPGYNWQYLASGGTIYRGDNSVASGKFRATFVVPKDISYADTSGRGRLVAYISRTANDGLGFSTAIQISGTDSSAIVDHDGPVVQVSLNSRNFRPGDVVGENPTLIVDLRDSSGINTSTAGIGHRIEAWLNTSKESVDLTEYYTSTKDNFHEGAVEKQLTGLQSGRNSIRVRAWDSYNNSTTVETYFEVASSDQLSISDLFNYPNPFTDETLFTFRHNQSGVLDVRIKIYSIAGRLIQDLQTLSMGDMMVRVPWDGRDRDGDKVANGVYLYKVIVRTADGKFGSEAIGKLAVAR